MKATVRRPIRRPNMRRAVILFPSGLTLGNLFFGIFAIIAASRLEFTTAGVYVMLGGICDALDGRVARATNAGTEFGEELDSLVDAITFGLAPGMIMYFAVLNRDGWDWVWVFLFAACAVMRLARFNIEQAGTAKTYFQGLPSPAAGITLASYYWFSQSPLYTYGAIGDLPWHGMLRLLMAGLAGLMISNVPYPSFPRTGFRSLRAIGASLLVFGSIVLLATRKLEFFFPIALVYVAWGLVRWVFSGLFERRQPTVPYDLSEGEDEEDDEEFELTDSRVHATRQGHREERSARVERPLSARGEHTVREEAPPRERAPHAAARPERKERPERAERPQRSERPVETERAARRDKKKEGPKRPDRPAAASAAPVAPAPVAAAPVSGMDAITLGTPAAEQSSGDDDELVATSGAATPETPTATDGVPSRKRKRRRRRGERKERSSASEATDDSGGSTGAARGTTAQAPLASTRAQPAPEAEPSPYASSSAQSFLPGLAEPTAAPRAPAAAPPASPPSSTPPSSTEPSE
jgi:CDP-diacylglycerol--serine O-phosphatidyltransferase